MRPLRSMRGVDNDTNENKTNTEVIRGELKRVTPEQILINKDEQLAKVEAKTDKLISKARKHKESTVPTQSTPTVHTTPTHRLPKTKRSVSYFTYICLSSSKLPKNILMIIAERAQYQSNGTWMSIVFTHEIMDRTKKSAHQISEAFHRLEREGWFKLIHSNNSGGRALEINPNHYGLKQPVQ